MIEGHNDLFSKRLPWLCNVYDKIIFSWSCTWRLRDICSLKFLDAANHKHLNGANRNIYHRPFKKTGSAMQMTASPLKLIADGLKRKDRDETMAAQWTLKKKRVATMRKTGLFSSKGWSADCIGHVVEHDYIWFLPNYLVRACCRGNLGNAICNSSLLKFCWSYEWAGKRNMSFDWRPIHSGDRFEKCMNLWILCSHLGRLLLEIGQRES